MRTQALLAVALLLALQITAQQPSPVWQLQSSGTTAGLRGIDSVDGTIAWASGTGGTVLRTTDGGQHWTRCATPDASKDGATLDFRGIQAWDANTAIVMASGPGDKSRLYKTTDACKSWTLLFTNPDAPNGFWDAFAAQTAVAGAGLGEVCKAGSRVIEGAILGDPAVHKFNKRDTTKSPSFYLAGFEIGIDCPGESLSPSASSIFSQPSEAAFAASNSVLLRIGPGTYWIATRTRLIQYSAGLTRPSHYFAENFCDIGFPNYQVVNPVPSAGVFSVAIRPGSSKPPKSIKIGGFDWRKPSCDKADMVAVGGDYKAPDDRQNTAAFTGNTNKFHAAETPPHGFRSAVQYSATLQAWITVGTNGSDISRDDGRTWQPLDNGNWNALSLPFVVGPNGRIAKLNHSAIPQP
ncbi:MAG TPA: hypothetical protein VFU68_03935 [Terracidiphilus sp.]|nr:hypothetical protein [Terracidiphilus sp.]